MHRFDHSQRYSKTVHKSTTRLVKTVHIANGVSLAMPYSFQLRGGRRHWHKDGGSSDLQNVTDQCVQRKTGVSIWERLAVEDPKNDQDDAEGDSC